MDAKGASSALPYLRSCKEECSQPITGEQKGEIPKWLKGTLIRVGPGLLEIGPDRFNHVFDSMALMHAFRFADGTVSYRNRFLRSNSYKNNHKANRIVASEFGTRGAPDPCKTIFQRFSSLFSMGEFTDNDLVTIVQYSDEVYACSETNYIWRIDPENLESLSRVNLSKFVSVNAATAHAHEDRDGTVYNVGMSIGFNSSYNIVKFPPKDSKTASAFQGGSVVCRIPCSSFMHPCYHHSFAMTENFFIFVEQPLYLSVPRMAWAHFVAGSFGDSLSWDAKQMARFHVVRRDDGTLLNTKYVATSFFVFHHINAYEEGSHLVVDLSCYDKGEVIKSLYVKALEELYTKQDNADVPFVSRSRRYVLPLAVHEDIDEKGENLVSIEGCEATAVRQPDGSIFCESEILTGTEPWSLELPRINYEQCNGRKYRYFYAMGRSDTVERTHLAKVDVVNHTTVPWSESGVIPSEPVFIAEPDSDGGEDSGVILASLLYRDDERKVSMLVLDARTMKEIGRVNFTTESSVPGDFHGAFIQPS